MKKILTKYTDEIHTYLTVRPEVADILAGKAASEIRDACRLNDIEKNARKKKLSRMLIKAKGIF